MMAQDPVKLSVEFHEGSDELFQTPEQDVETLLLEYQRHAFLCYQWAAWVTSWSRYELDCGRRIVTETPGAYALYCDTDSVKYIGDVDWTAYNRERIKASTRSGAHATDPKGNEHYMGVFESEPAVKNFCTLGSKKYAYEYQDGHIGITVAGVHKQKGAAELEKAGGLTAFHDGFVFKDAGGLESIYNDTPGSRFIEIDGHTWEIGPNIYLKPSTYTLGQTYEYLMLLQDPDLYEQIRRRFR